MFGSNVPPTEVTDTPEPQTLEGSTVRDGVRDPRATVPAWEAFSRYRTRVSVPPL